MLSDITLFRLWENIQTIKHNVILDTPSFFVRAASVNDVRELANLLTLSFYSHEKWMEILHPVLSFGIREDLRTRMHAKRQPYACLVACYPKELEAIDSDLKQASKKHIISSKKSMAEAAEVMTNSTESSSKTGRVIDRMAPIVGTVEVSVKRSPFSFFSPDYVYISNLATHPYYRRQGVAQHLLEACELFAKRWGFREIYLHVLENNDRARCLYQKLGYTIKQSESGLSTWLMGQPKQLLLVKSLAGHNSVTVASDEG